MSGTRPTVSVIMATYNGARTIAASVRSILTQTFGPLELIVADDGSTDDTLRILGGIEDDRLVVLRNDRNFGVVASRNRCMAQARGRYVAMLDHDDLSMPTRLARQVAYLDANPGTVLLGTAARTLEDGALRSMGTPEHTTPELIAWLLHLANPLVCSSVMFRADAVHKLGVFMRKEFTYADDYDFYHRIAALGAVARLDEPLTIYRIHDSNAYKRHERVMRDNAQRVLEPAYGPLFGDEAGRASRLVVDHLAGGWGIASLADLRRLAEVFEHLNQHFLAGLDRKTSSALLRHAGQLWGRVLSASLRTGKVGVAGLLSCRVSGFRPGGAEFARLATDWMPMRRSLASLVRRPGPARQAPRPGRLFDMRYLPVPPDPLAPPTLFVVVDTEAEFDWNKPFARELTSVTAMDDIERGQDIFDRYGLKPIYAIDYPVASQERGFARLAAIHARQGCEIGAHLHPWTTPPFEEDVSTRNSYPGNLDPALEERKLAVLMQAIRRSFNISPVFYKAGRYGFGPATPAALVRHGIRVDLSVLPFADLRRRGGPDFQALQPIAYRIDGTAILSLPMTRSHVGAWPALAGVARAMDNLPAGRSLHLNSVLARLGLFETITLTPEGVTVSEQVRLIRTMLKHGTRQFVLHYHSPSLSPGHTPYVRDQAGLQILLSRLSEVCRFFFQELGGLPGDPAELLTMADRQPFSD